MQHRMNFYENGTFGMESSAEQQQYYQNNRAFGTRAADSSTPLPSRLNTSSRLKFNMMRASTTRRKMAPTSQNGGLASASFSYTESHQVKAPPNRTRAGETKLTASSSSWLLTAATTISTGRVIGSRLMPMLGASSHEDAAVLADLASSGHLGHGGPPHGGLTLGEPGAMPPIGGKKPSHEHAEHEVQLIAAISLLVLVIVVGIVGQALIVVCGACEACFSEAEPQNFSAEEDSETNISSSGARNKYSNLMAKNKLTDGYRREKQSSQDSSTHPPLLAHASAPNLTVKKHSDDSLEGRGHSAAAAVAAAGIYLAASTAVSDASMGASSSENNNDFNASMSTRNDEVFDQVPVSRLYQSPPPELFHPSDSVEQLRNVNEQQPNASAKSPRSGRRNRMRHYQQKSPAKVSFFDNPYSGV